MARHVQLSEKRFWAVQSDGRLPRGMFSASGRPQRWVLRGGLPEQPAAENVGVPGPNRPPGQAYPGDDHDREHTFWSAGRRARSGLGDYFLGSGVQVGKGGWEAQTHPHLPVPFPSLRGPETTQSGRRIGLPDGQGDGRIPDHPGSEFTARNRQRRGGSYPSTLASTGAFFVDTQLEEEVDIQGTNRVTSSPVKGTFEPNPTGTTTKSSATCP